MSEFMRGEFKVYLAGPISGQSFAAAADWRKYAKQELFWASEGRIEGISPLRYKEYLRDEKHIAESYEHITLSSAKLITCRDRMDCKRSDAVLINVLDAKTVSIGTMIELGCAEELGKP